MKESLILLAAILFISRFSFSQQTLIETFGAPSSTTDISAYEAAGGFDLDNLTFSGTGEVRTTLPSENYSGASGQGNIFLSNSPSGETLTVDGLTPSGCTNINLSFGVHKARNDQDGKLLRIEYSINNGSSFSSAGSITLPTGSGTTGWYLRSISGLPTSITTIRFTNDNTAGNGFFRIDDLQIVGVGTGCALPVELLSFNGEKRTSSIHLHWRTATEQNNDYMAVERSADGVKFEELGRVKGAGDTQAPQEYSFVDEGPIRGLNYYRLRQVDFDGAFEYHKTISVLFQGKESELGVKAFPNPAQNGSLQASWAAAPDQPTTLQVLDMTGRKLAEYQAPAGASTYELPLSSIPSGLYILQASQGERTETLRFRR